VDHVELTDQSRGFLVAEVELRHDLKIVVETRRRALHA
jgi:hypothetical protein